MKFNELSKWQLSDSNLGLLLYVERSLELSYDGTPVAEKNIAPTVWEILEDCYKLLSLVEMGVRRNAADELAYFLEKLIISIKKDSIAKDMLYGNDDYMLNRLSTKNPEELKTLLNLIDATLSHGLYWDKLKFRAYELVKDKNKKKDIIDIADKCFYFLIKSGYVKSSIYYLLQKTFFFEKNDGLIKDHTYITKYFDLFDLKKKRFDIYFKCSSKIENLKGAFDIFSIDFVENATPKYNLKLERKFFKKESSFVVCSNIKALDYLHAVQVARGRLNKISNIFSFMYHKSKFWYSNNCLVYNKNKEHVVELTVPLNTMSKTADVGIDYAKENLGVFLKSFRMHPESFDRFNQSIELHALALKTDSLSAQVLNLWICMESLLVTGKGSHVGEVETYLTNVICNDYLADKLDDLNLYLTCWNKDFYEECLSKTSSSSTYRIFQLAELLCHAENENILREIGESLSNSEPSPLLLNKIWETSQLLKSVKKIKDLRKKIREEIKFNIKRIYLLRNEIVHQGEVNKANENIVELAHYYLDNILNKIVMKSYDRRKFIGDFLYEQKMVGEEYDRLLDSLSENTIIDQTNIKRIIFSPDYRIFK